MVNCFYSWRLHHCLSPLSGSLPAALILPVSSCYCWFLWWYPYSADSSHNAEGPHGHSRISLARNWHAFGFSVPLVWGPHRNTSCESNFFVIAFSIENQNSLTCSIIGFLLRSFQKHIKIITHSVHNWETDTFIINWIDFVIAVLPKNVFQIFWENCIVESVTMIQFFSLLINE